MKKIVRRESTKPRSKTGTASTPIAKDETTIFAENHYHTISATPAPTLTRCRECPPSSQPSSDLYPSSHHPVPFRFLAAQRRTLRLPAGSWRRANHQLGRPRWVRQEPQKCRLEVLSLGLCHSASSCPHGNPSFRPLSRGNAEYEWVH